MIKAVLFDCFSVLIGDATKAAVQELSYASPDKAEQFRAATRAVDSGIMTEEEVRPLQASLLGISENELTALRDSGEVRNVELINYIRTTLKGKYKLALVSNIGSRSHLEKRFLPNELDELFDVVIASGDVGAIKPNPEIYYLAAARLGIDPQEGVMIDDIESFCIGARDVGMHAIYFKNTKQAISNLEQLIDSSNKS